MQVRRIKTQNEITKIISIVNQLSMIMQVTVNDVQKIKVIADEEHNSYTSGYRLATKC